MCPKDMNKTRCTFTIKYGRLSVCRHCVVFSFASWLKKVKLLCMLSVCRKIPLRHEKSEDFIPVSACVVF